MALSDFPRHIADHGHTKLTRRTFLSLSLVAHSVDRDADEPEEFIACVLQEQGAGGEGVAQV